MIERPKEDRLRDLATRRAALERELKHAQVRVRNAETLLKDVNDEIARLGAGDGGEK